MPVRLKMFKLEQGMNCKLYIIKDTTPDTTNSVYFVCREDKVGEPIEVVNTTRKFREVIKHAMSMDFDGVLMYKVHMEVPDIEDRVERSKNTVIAPITNLRDSDKADMEIIYNEIIKLMEKLDEQVDNLISRTKENLDSCTSAEGDELTCNLFALDRNLNRLLDTINRRAQLNRTPIALLIGILKQHNGDKEIVRSYKLLQGLLDSQALGEVERVNKLLQDFRESGIANIGQLMNILEAEFNANRRIKKSNSF